MKRHARRSAFTLIELLIVVAVISILACLSFPALGYVREKARKDECLNHLRQWGIALQGYLDEHQGLFPSCGKDKTTEKAWYNVLPAYLGTTAMSEFQKTPLPGAGIRTPFLCPSDHGTGDSQNGGYYSSYAFNTWIDNGGPGEKRLRLSQLNSSHEPPIALASFVVFAETGTGGKPGVNLGSLTAEAFRHTRSFNVGFADGHAENILQISAWKSGLTANDNFGGLHWNPTQKNTDGAKP